MSAPTLGAALDVIERFGWVRAPYYRTSSERSDRSYHLTAEERVPLDEVERIPLLEALWLSPCLWENQLELVSGAEHQVRSGLGADADPVDAGRRKARAVGFNRHLKPAGVERCHQILVELQQRLATRADHQGPDVQRGLCGPQRRHGLRQSRR